MPHTARERLAKLLDDAESPGAFSAQLLARADSLHLALIIHADPAPILAAPHRRRISQPVGRRP